MIKKIIGYVAALMMAAAACTGFTVAGQGYEIYQAAVAETSLESMVDSIRSKEGYTTLEELPDTYLNAVVSVEDHRFYSHFGLDPIAICRALVNDIRAGRYVEGGSTITQQLAKNLYSARKRRWRGRLPRYSQPWSWRESTVRMRFWNCMSTPFPSETDTIQQEMPAADILEKSPGR